MNIYGYIKPLLDFIFGVLLTILLSPIMLIIAIIIKLDSKGPVLFKQNRFGKNKTIFGIYKFRTMRIDSPKDMPTHLFNNAEAFITKIGRFLRKSSLDELPQLFNILAGQMSFIGPRPALWNQEDLIAARDLPLTDEFPCPSSNSFKPGITGWAQINGRDELPIEEKARLDNEYAAKISFFLDIKILFLTVINVLSRKGISEGGSKE